MILERSQIGAVVIGGSAGSLEALSQILPGLPADFPKPILVVVHVPAGRPSLLAEVLQTKCTLRIKEADEKETLDPGTVYFAPPDYHLLVEVDGTIALSCDEPMLFSRPSIDMLFESAADFYESSLTAVVLSGANCDGAEGLKAVHDAGGDTVIQKPSCALVATMPESALAKCPAARSLEPKEIVDYLRNGVRQ